MMEEKIIGHSTKLFFNSVESLFIRPKGYVVWSNRCLLQVLLNDCFCQMVLHDSTEWIWHSIELDSVLMLNPSSSLGFDRFFHMSEWMRFNSTEWAFHLAKWALILLFAFSGSQLLYLVCRQTHILKNVIRRKLQLLLLSPRLIFLISFKHKYFKLSTLIIFLIKS